MEGGDAVWRVVASCVRLYKAGRDCADAGAEAEPCCTTDDKEVFANAWSLRSSSSSSSSSVVGGDGGGDYSLLSSNRSEVDALLASGSWTEVCNPISGPTGVFCVNTSMADARDGPFMLYSVAVAGVPQGGGVRPLLRCVGGSGAQRRHFFSTDAACEGAGTADGVLGYIAVKRGGEMLRALRRCKGPGAGQRMHSLDLLCDEPDGDGEPLGFVR